MLFHIISPFQVKICRISKIGGRGKKIAFPPDTLGTKDFLPQYHPDSRPRRALVARNGADRPRISSRLLEGEPSDIPQTGSQPPTGPLYAEQTRYFPFHSICLIGTYITEKRNLQGGICPLPAKKRQKRKISRIFLCALPFSCPKRGKTALYNVQKRGIL
ncbi:MAG: hypothetical protein ACLTG0_17075 [Oscillibacter sp.]